MIKCHLGLFVYSILVIWMSSTCTVTGGAECCMNPGRKVRVNIVDFAARKRMHHIR